MRTGTLIDVSSSDHRRLEVLALQLPISFEVSLLRDGLVGSSPTRPCDDAGWLYAALG